jgi:hypothetical protein
VDRTRGNPSDPPGTGVIGFAGGIRGLIDCGPGGVGFDISGSAGRMLLANDGAVTALWTREGNGPFVTRQFPAPPPSNDPRLAAVADLAGALCESRPTACDLEVATRSLEIGLGFHASDAQGGGRVSLPLSERGLRVESLPWGNV